jgi:hypothetical protein
MNWNVILPVAAIVLTVVFVAWWMTGGFGQNTYGQAISGNGGITYKLISKDIYTYSKYGPTISNNLIAYFTNQGLNKLHVYDIPSGSVMGTKYFSSQGLYMRLDGNILAHNFQAQSGVTVENIFKYDAGKVLGEGIGFPGIHGNKVVYRSLNNNLILYDLITDTSQTISIPVQCAGAEADIWGNTVAYFCIGDHGIHVYDISTHTDTTLVTNLAPNVLGMNNPVSISGNRVVYSEAYGVFVYNLQSGVITKLSGPGTALPDISGNRVIFIEVNNDDNVLMMATLPQEPAPTCNPKFEDCYGSAAVPAGS